MVSINHGTCDTLPSLRVLTPGPGSLPFPTLLFLPHQQVKAAEKYTFPVGFKVMLVKINKFYNYDFGLALLASTKWLIISQTAFPGMLEDTEGSEARRSCGWIRSGNPHISPLLRHSQSISRNYEINTCINSLSLATPNIFHHNPSCPLPTRAFLLGVLTNIFCSSEEVIKMGITAMWIGFSTNIW